MNWATRICNVFLQNVIFEQPHKKWINDGKKSFFALHRFGLEVYIIGAKNGIFPIFFALAMPNNGIFSDISGRTLSNQISTKGR